MRQDGIPRSGKHPGALNLPPTSTTPSAGLRICPGVSFATGTEIPRFPNKTVAQKIPTTYTSAMDFVSHALWGGVSFGRRNKKIFLLAAGISVLPDILTEGLFFVLYLLNIGGMPGWANGHPNISDYPMYAQNLYNITHSFVVFVLVFVLILVVARKPVWLVAAWGLHILIDIPTHSLSLFPTPFLWPLSNFKVDGIGWHNPIVLAIDIILLIVAYSLWLYPKIHRKQ